MRIFNVRDFGAIGDGAALDTEALQRTIDAAGAAKGGVAWLPPGEYRSGMLRLVSNFTLRIAAGARLKASGDDDEFRCDETIREDSPWSWRYYFLYGENVENVILEGDGVIDGNGPAFWFTDRLYWSDTPPARLDPDRSILDYQVYKPKENRPMMIHCRDCRNIKIRDLRLVNSAVYTVWLLGCDEVRLSNLTVRNDRLAPNGDALDIDSCSHVLIDNCDIESGDDCIALKSDAARLGRAKACEKIAVSNCIFSSPTCGIRIGYEGDAPIRDAVFTNLIFNRTRNGVFLMSVRPAKGHIFEGTPIERMTFANLIMRGVGRPIYMWAGNEADATGYSAHIRDISFAGLVGDGVDTIFIGSSGETAIFDISLSGVNLKLHQDTEFYRGKDTVEIPNLWGPGKTAALLTIRRAAAVRLCDVNLSGNLPAMHWNEAENLSIDGELQLSSGKRS